MAAAAPVRTNWHPDKKHSDFERWVCIYPAYINSKKTRQEGRRLAKDKCIENPTYAQIRDVLSVTKMPCSVENKQYSRERSRELHCRGRIRIQMRNDDGSILNPELGTRDDILLFIASRIPLLKSYQNKPTNEAFSAPAQGSAGGQLNSGVANSAGGGGGNKKRRNKRH